MVAGARPELRTALRLERRGHGGIRSRAHLSRPRGRLAAQRLPRRQGRYGPRRMGLRNRRGARRGRAPRSRTEVAGLVVALYAAVGAAVTWPALRHADSDFLALAEPGHGDRKSTRLNSSHT